MNESAWRIFTSLPLKKARSSIGASVVSPAMTPLLYPPPPPPYGCHPPAGHQPSKDQSQPPPPGIWHLPTDVPPPLLTCHPSLLVAVYGDGWWQRNTLAFGAISLVFFPWSQRKWGCTRIHRDLKMPPLGSFPFNNNCLVKPSPTQDPLFHPTKFLFSIQTPDICQNYLSEILHKISHVWSKTEWRKTFCSTTHNGTLVSNIYCSEGQTLSGCATQEHSTYKWEKSFLFDGNWWKFNPIVPPRQGIIYIASKCRRDEKICF